MELFDLFYQALTANGVLFRHIALSLLGLMLFCFFVQLWYYLKLYGGLPRFRNNRGIRIEIPTPPISVIVVVRENNYFFVFILLKQIAAITLITSKRMAK